MKVLVMVSVFISILVSIVFGLTSLETNKKKFVSMVKSFVKTLDQSWYNKTVFSFNDKERFNWHYIPRSRKGFPLKDMTKVQSETAFALLRGALSDEGYKKATGIMQLEDILRVLEGRSPNDSYRDPQAYYLSFFSKPQLNEPWGWRTEGHHLSLNYSLIGDSMISTTPMFMGTNPSTVPSGIHKGKQILKDEEELARKLVNSLNQEQLNMAIFATRAPRDIITGVERKVSLKKPVGISVSQLSISQKEILLKLLKVYLSNNSHEMARSQYEKIEKAGLNNLFFAWAGRQQPGEGHYYRLHGPTILIEYDNTQNNANHVHTVVRDLDNDFGEDVLHKHYMYGGHTH